MSSLYPLFADLADRPVLVVGGGAVGERKAEALRAAGARVTVGAPTLTATLARRARNGRLRHRPGRFDPSWLHGVWLVIAATNDRSLNRRVAAVATARRIWVNVVDDPALSSFQVPAVVHRPPLVVAISSGGAVPALARHVRERLESVLDDALSVLAGLLARHRASIRDRIADIGVRRRFYDEVITGEVGDLVRRRQPDRAERALLRHLGRSTSRSGPRPGNVALVGAGPGDPGLLTLAGLRRLQAADVILHDRLVGPGVLALARRDAELIDVGKRPGRQGGGQDAINALMVTLAGAGRRVVRLKGGDPFIFGRGGEELEHLHRHGVPYEVIPGITAASACAAYAGIPLTHRDHAQSVRLVTAHCQSSLDLLDWPALAQERQTLAVYMAVGQLARLREQLIHNGRDPATPFALVENGTTQHQRVVTGTLASLSEVSKTHAVSSPALLIIGEVAALAGPLAWFGMPPLSGSRSRARHAA